MYAALATSRKPAVGKYMPFNSAKAAFCSRSCLPAMSLGCAGVWAKFGNILGDVLSITVIVVAIL